MSFPYLNNDTLPEQRQVNVFALNKFGIIEEKSYLCKWKDT